MQFIVDDGVPGRGHRENIYNKAFTHAGVACGCDILNFDGCCIAFGTDIYEYGPTVATIIP